MKYIVVEIQTNKDGTVGNLVYSFDDWNAAQSKYHLILSSAAVSNIPCHSVVLLTSEGGLLETMHYTNKEV